MMASMLTHRTCLGNGFAFALVLLVGGCAPALSTFQTAAVPPTGHYSAAIGMEGSIAAGELYDAYTSGKHVLDKAQSDQPLTTAEKWEAFDAGVALLLNPPAFGYHMSFAYVPWKRLEVSLRYASSTLRLATRYQVLDREAGDPIDMSIGIGASRFTYSVPFADYVPILKVEDFTRWQFDVPLLIGMQNRWFRVWGGPRFAMTFFDMSLKLDLQVEEPVLASMSGHSYYAGGQAGIGFGYRWIFFAFELTVVESIGSARFDAPAMTESPRHDVDLSTLVVYPSFGFMGQW
jgi:hypothetical protein